MAGTGRLSSRYTSVPPSPKVIPSTSPATWPAIVLHVVALLALGYSFQQLFAPAEITDYMASQFGGRWAFLTVLSLTATIVTFVVALLKDLFPSVTGFDLVKTRLTILVVPVEGIVSLLYWGLTAYDPTLLIPPESKFQLPLALDIGLHALPAFFLWTDFLLFSPRMSSKANPLAVSAIATGFYVTWMEYTAKHNGHFPYPFLNDLERSARAGIYVVAIFVLYSLFHSANGIHSLLRSETKPGPEAEIVKKLQ